MTEPGVPPTRPQRTPDGQEPVWDPAIVEPLRDEVFAHLTTDDNFQFSSDPEDYSLINIKGVDYRYQILVRGLQWWDDPE